MSKLLQELIEEFQEKMKGFNEDIIARDYSFPNVPNKIMITKGMKKTGKACFLLQTIKNLLENHLDFSRILYLNFEDDCLYPLTQKKLSGLLDSFYRLHPDNHDRNCYLFLDKIQNIEQWPAVIRRYFDTRKVQIFKDINDQETIARETRALREAETELGIKGQLITSEVYLKEWILS